MTRTTTTLSLCEMLKKEIGISHYPIQFDKANVSSFFVNLILNPWYLNECF